MITPTIKRCEDFPGACCRTCHGKHAAPNSLLGNQLQEIVVFIGKDHTATFAEVCCAKVVTADDAALAWSKIQRAQSE